MNMRLLAGRHCADPLTRPAADLSPGGEVGERAAEPAAKPVEH
jgi:hypothetical protein